ncbi:unnamed protein product [Prorocentrum cordatum]|uniref:Uncharacterized protein n=1 Tax=Prorocentrum cordatum TaxID=2364126 RepID=A0ABN9TFC4_9DINO|nr:unnamed protein product [Polarella glacialis]
MRVPRAQKREAQTMADSRWCPAGFADTCRPWAGRTEARSAGKSFSAQLDLLAASGRARWRGACHGHPRIPMPSRMMSWWTSRTDIGAHLRRKRSA